MFLHITIVARIVDAVPAEIQQEERHQAGKIQVCGDDDSPLVSGDFQQFVIRGTILADLVGMHSFVPVGLEHVEQQGGYRHIQQKLHAANSMTSSSASIAA